MNIAFVIDGWESLNPETTSTIRLIYEAASRGHTVGIVRPKSLTIRNNITYALVKRLAAVSPLPKNLTSFWKKGLTVGKRLPLKGFDVVFLRKSPPLDQNILNFLDSVRDDTLLINDVEGIRKASSKIYMTTFEDSHEITPKTYVSKDKSYLMSVIEENEAERLVLKPLDGHQGNGVILLEKQAKDSISSILDFYLNSNPNRSYLILQEYLEAAVHGDVRVMMLNGEPIGAMKRIPQSGEFRANIHTGGTAARHVLTRGEKEVCRRIGPKLVNDGLYLAGVDLIGEKVIEVNVRNPGGIFRINKLNRCRLETKIIEFAEDFYRRREGALERKRLFRQEIAEG